MATVNSLDIRGPYFPKRLEGAGFSASDGYKL